MVNFVLPGFDLYKGLNSTLITLMKDKSYLFYDDIKVYALYDCFNNQKWNGGRVRLGIHDISSIKSIINYFNSLDVKLRFTYTNSLLTEDLYRNHYCNIVTGLANNGFNEICVYDFKLMEYIKKWYDGYKWILSTTACIQSKAKIEEMLEKFDFVVLDYRLNSNRDVLSKLSNRDRAEILLNESCSPRCNCREMHYRWESKSQIEGKPCTFVCKNPNMGSIFFSSKKYSTFVTVEDLYEWFVPNGYYYFKIMGRGISELDVIESYVYYMVKPEYRDEVRLSLIESNLYEITKNKEKLTERS